MKVRYSSYLVCCNCFTYDDRWLRGIRLFAEPTNIAGRLGDIQSSGARLDLQLQPGWRMDASRIKIYWYTPALLSWHCSPGETAVKTLIALIRRISMRSLQLRGCSFPHRSAVRCPR
jgi:hypothetical protein